MPTYAILGATGATGQCILNHLLLRSPDTKTKIHAYARSRSKLEKLSPKISTNPNVTIFEGALDNIPLLASCLTGTDTVFVVLGANVSSPGMRIVQDGAHSLVAALCYIKAQDPGAKMPKILVLSSCAVNPRLQRHMPALAVKFMHTALHYAYDDLEHAQAFLELHKSWLDVTFIQPGGLSDDEVQRGHMLSTEDVSSGFISYKDLAAGMIEVAETKGDKYSWKGVAVLPASKDVKFPWDAPRNVIRGLFSYSMPPVYGACRSMGLVL